MVFWVYANVEKTAVKGMASDFYFLTYHYNFGNKNDEFNQNFEFSFKKSLFTEGVIETLLKELTPICFVKKIHRLEQPARFAKFEKDKPLKIEGIYGVANW